MKKNLYIFRHGETDYNLRGICQGCFCDLPLNETGRQQAQELGKKLASANIEIIFCSPMSRALTTARAVIGDCFKEGSIVVNKDLREANLGVAEGTSLQIVRQKYPDVLEKFLNPTLENWNTAFPGYNSESRQRIFERVIKVIYDIVKKPYANIGISTHGGVIGALVCGLKFPPFDCGNCGVIHLVYDTETKCFSQVV